MISYSSTGTNHEGLPFDVMFISGNVNRITCEHFNAWAQKSIPTEKWKPPPVSWVKINFDVVIRNSHSAQAVVYRNHHGHIIQMMSEINPPCSPNLREAIVAMLAIKLAFSLNLHKVIIEGDSQTIISAMIQPDIIQDWRIYPLITNIIDSIPIGFL